MSWKSRLLTIDLTKSETCSNLVEGAHAVVRGSLISVMVILCCLMLSRDRSRLTEGLGAHWSD